MRNIKFRVWEVTMSEDWNRQRGITKKGLMIYDIKNIDMNPERYELMQFVGIKDKNGKEIYEGDILELIEPEVEGKQTEFGKCVVKFGEYSTLDIESGDISLGWYMEGYHGYRRRDLFKDQYEKIDSILDSAKTKYKTGWEVTGNIYEDSHLLKDTEN